MYTEYEKNTQKAPPLINHFFPPNFLVLPSKASSTSEKPPVGQAFVFWGGLAGMIFVPVFSGLTQCPAWKLGTLSWLRWKLVGWWCFFRVFSFFFGGVLSEVGFFVHLLCCFMVGVSARILGLARLRCTIYHLLNRWMVQWNMGRQTIDILFQAKEKAIFSPKQLDGPESKYKSDHQFLYLCHGVSYSSLSTIASRRIHPIKRWFRPIYIMQRHLFLDTFFVFPHGNNFFCYAHFEEWHDVEFGPLDCMLRSWASSLWH